MMRLTILIILCLVAAACFRPQTPPDTPPPKTSTPDVALRIRLALITRDGISPWAEWEINERVGPLNRAYRDAGIRFDIRGTERIERPDLFDISTGDLPVAQRLCADWANHNHELLILLVSSIAVDDQALGGLAWYPPSHGVMIARGSCRNVLIHELGHALALPHTWEDPFGDTPGDTPCNLFDRCNPMNYCCVICSERSFSSEQIETMRRAVLSEPRRAVADIGAVKLDGAKSAPPRTATGDLAICNP